MNETKKLIQQITEGIQDKKGKNIVIADLSKIGDTICNYLVICQGNSPSQVTAIVESVKEFTRKGANSKPFAIDGLRNADDFIFPVINQSGYFIYSFRQLTIGIGDVVNNKCLVSCILFKSLYDLTDHIFLILFHSVRDFIVYSKCLIRFLCSKDRRI